MSLAHKMAQDGFDSDTDESDGEAIDRIRGSSSPLACTSALMQVGIYLKLCGHDIRARKGTFCLGVASCFIVVVVTALMVTVMARLPVLFMRLGEIERGQGDMKLTAGGQAAGARSLNYSKILTNSRFVPPQRASLHAPRVDFAPELTLLWPLSACLNAQGQPPVAADPASFQFLWYANPALNVTASPDAPPGFSPDASRCPIQYGCPEEHCPVARRYQARIYAIDFAREERMGFGREWASPSPGPGECVLERAVADRLGVTVGDSLMASVDSGDRILQAFIEAELDDWLAPPYTTWGRTMMPLRVIAIAPNGGGKLPTEADPFVFIDYRSMLTHMAPFLNPRLGARKRQLFADTDPNILANEVWFNIPPAERLAIYAQTDAADVLADATAFGTPIIAAVGFNQVDVEMPLVSYILANQFFSLFLGLILSLMILGLGFLCIVLIHSLLTVGVETRTFELGIMRMVGMTRGMLSGYVVTGALLFAIPAWALGLIIAQAGFFFLVGTLRDSLGVELSPYLTPDAIGYATLVGLGMPLVSSIAPIVQVLALDLPKALDTSRSKTTAIEYDIQKGGEYHVSWEAAGIGLAMAIAGFLIYYLFPLALITFNITLLFYIFFGILLGMLFGLVLLTTSLEGVVEICVMYVFLWWESPAVLQMVKKNLIAHRKRNRKTTLMFAMSIGFLIFLSVTASIQIQSVIFTFERFYGGPLNIRGGSSGMSHAAAEVIDSALVELQSTNYSYLRWTWNGASLDDQDNLDNATVSTVGRYKQFDPTIIAVAPNYWETALRKYYIPDEVLDASWPLAESLYSYPGSSRAVISTAMKKWLGLLGMDDAFMLVLDRDIGNTSVQSRGLAQSAAWLDSSPGVSFSKFAANLGRVIIVSAPDLISRAQGSISSVERLKFDEFIIMVTEADLPAVSRYVTRILQNTGRLSEVSVRNFFSLRDSLQVAVDVLTIFFTFAQAMATFICYFALSSSMSTNIHEQAKEIGVLRCIGFRKAPMTRTYVWEAFVLVCASSLLGIGVGVVMGYTIVLQRALFTQLPLPFVFPWVQLLVVLALSFLLALLSSFGPIRAMLATRSVSSILKSAL